MGTLDDEGLVIGLDYFEFVNFVVVHDHATGALIRLKTGQGNFAFLDDHLALFGYEAMSDPVAVEGGLRTGVPCSGGYYGVKGFA